MIAADDDHNTCNFGKTNALGGSQKHRCRVVLPIFPNDQKSKDGALFTDFNDLHVNFGADIVKKQLSRNRILTQSIFRLFFHKKYPKEAHPFPMAPRTRIGHDLCTKRNWKDLCCFINRPTGSDGRSDI